MFAISNSLSNLSNVTPLLFNLKRNIYKKHFLVWKLFAFSSLKPWNSINLYICIFKNIYPVSNAQVLNKKLPVVSLLFYPHRIKRQRFHSGQKEAKSLNPLSGDIKVTIPNGICKVYDIIPPPFSLIERFIKISQSSSIQRNHPSAIGKIEPISARKRLL